MRLTDWDLLYALAQVAVKVKQNWKGLLIYVTVMYAQLVVMLIQKSHEKCRWAFMISCILWVVGTMVFVIILDHRILVGLYIFVFALKLGQLRVLKKFMDRLYSLRCQRRDNNKPPLTN